MTEWAECPEPDCPLPAVVTDRQWLDSTDGPVEHARITCPRRALVLLHRPVRTVLLALLLVAGGCNPSAPGHEPEVAVPGVRPAPPELHVFFIPSPSSAATTDTTLTTRARLRDASHRAKKVYPGPVGEMISQEILSWEEFVHIYDSKGLMMQVVAQIFDTPIPPVVTTSEAP